MSKGSPRHISGHPSPDTTASEGNSSVQVNLDSSSNRGRSIGRRSRSPSMRPSPSRGAEMSLARQATANSLSSFLTSQASSQHSQHDRAPAEDVLRDLIAVTESSNDSPQNETNHGVKRPHDDEEGEVPIPKRDKLSEELERMFPSPSAQTTAVIQAQSSASATTADDHAAAGAQPQVGPTVTQESRATLPIRTTPRSPSDMGNGASSAAAEHDEDGSNFPSESQET